MKIISIYSNVLIAFAGQLSLPDKANVFVLSEFTKIAATIPPSKSNEGYYSTLHIDYLDRLAEWRNVTETNACDPRSRILLPTGTFKTMMFTIEPAEAGEGLSILTDPADLIVAGGSVGHYDTNGARIDYIDTLRFVYNFEAIANADEVGIWIKFPADELRVINAPDNGVPTNGMTANIVEVKEGFSNLSHIMTINTYIQASLSASTWAMAQLFYSTGVFDVFDGDNATVWLKADYNSTLISKGGDIYSMECGWDNDFSKCIVDGNLTNHARVGRNSLMITKNCTNIDVEDTGTCTEENNVANAIDDLLTEVKFDTSPSKTSNSTFSFCSSSSSFPLKTVFLEISFLASVIALFIC